MGFYLDVLVKKRHDKAYRNVIMESMEEIFVNMLLQERFIIGVTFGPILKEIWWSSWRNEHLKCQMYAHVHHAPNQGLQPIIAPFPFSTWGLDIIRKISSPSTDDHNFIITTTKYFTKWVESVPLTMVLGMVIANFLLNQIMCIDSKPHMS